jgi:hypothetical protein
VMLPAIKLCCGFKVPWVQSSCDITTARMPDGLKNVRLAILRSRWWSAWKHDTCDEIWINLTSNLTSGFKLSSSENYGSSSTKHLQHE